MSKPILCDVKSIDKFKEVFRVEAGSYDIFMRKMGEVFQFNWYYVLASKGEYLYSLFANACNKDFVWDCENELPF
ncbi:hypothetical protein [Microscilla marina]|uniref:Uncharacterized protein n=1 Tax=Microscilla marina ATCC 23134 TaxID=313606 RepID=A1ZH71_MICM2|nr:hypothetical protein [Microscilla marina]EAY30340.1 hypothetical protein M23134_08169 [Microscilla marina ATCC 23134]